MKYLLSFFLLLTLSACHVPRFFIYNFADIQDHKKFPSRPLTKSQKPFQFFAADSTSAKAPKEANGMPFGDFLSKHNTVAFLIIRKDTILYEQYFHKYNKDRVVPSFSMAKSYTSALIGIAISEGLIKSENELLSDLIPEWKSVKGMDKIKLKYVLDMSSGIRFNESYVNPFGHAARFYYGTGLSKATLKLRPKDEPAKKFKYHSGNTQILGEVLKRALAPSGRTITQYLQEKIWAPMQMESDASWSIDQKKNGMEKTFCCINATARDFAKFGRLYLHKGEFNGQQLVPAEWVKSSVPRDPKDRAFPFYNKQWWFPSKDADFMAEGILGQFIYVHPDKDLIMVRLGKNPGKVDWGKLMHDISGFYK